MEQIWALVISTAVTVIVTLTATLIFNKITGAPKKLKEQKAAQQAKLDAMEESLADVSERVAGVEETISHFPEHEAQLQETDASIVDLCREIRDDVVANRQLLTERLSNLERREKNSLRSKILNEYRLLTDSYKNPMQAWSEMEHHSFFKLVEDYEDLGGNDYVHNTIVPAMNELDIIYMDDLEGLKKLYDSRRAN